MLTCSQTRPYACVTLPEPQRQRCARQALASRLVAAHLCRVGKHALLDVFTARGRKRAEDHWPSLLADIQALVNSQSQNRPPVSHAAPLYALERRGSPTPTDRPKRLHG